jgi:CRP-like cAMP-binding protein
MVHPEGDVTFETGDFFGASALLLSDVPSAPFVTVTKTRLLKLHAEDLHRIEMLNPRFVDDIRKRAADPQFTSR